MTVVLNGRFFCLKLPFCLWSYLFYYRYVFRFMSASLLSVASEHNSVVAVVGKGHLPGISKNWKQPVEVRMDFIVTPRPLVIASFFWNPVLQVVFFIYVILKPTPTRIILNDVMPNEFCNPHFFESAIVLSMTKHISNQLNWSFYGNQGFSINASKITSCSFLW